MINMMDSAEDLIWDIFDANVKMDFECVMSVANRVLSHLSSSSVSDVEPLLCVFLSRLSDLNSQNFALHVKKSRMCSDEFDYLNLRVAIIVFGRHFYSKVIGGDYSDLSMCLSIASPMRKLFYEVIGALNVIVIGHRKISIGELGCYSDDVFLRIFRGNDAVKFNFEVTANRGPVGLHLLNDGEVMSEVNFKDLGLIRMGSFLRHVKLGIFWIYRMHNSPGGGVQIDAMFKERHTSLLLVEGAGLVTRF
jgi:hypothetical protein